MQFQVPQAGWQNLATAILNFHFSTASPGSSPEQLLNLILFRLCETHPNVHAELDDGTVTISRVHRAGDNHRWHEAVGTYNFADGFSYDSWLKEVPPEDFREEASAVLTQFVNKVERAFRRQHYSGRCIIWARIGSPLERAFTSIPPDTFAHFAITDWERGSAVCEDGSKLFSIHAAEPDRQQDLPFVEAIPNNGTDFRYQQVVKWIEATGARPRSNTVDGHTRAFLESRGEAKTGTLDPKTLKKAFTEVYGTEGGKRENRESLPSA